MSWPFLFKVFMALAANPRETPGRPQGARHEYRDKLPDSVNKLHLVDTCTHKTGAGLLRSRLIKQGML